MESRVSTSLKRSTSESDPRSGDALWISPHVEVGARAFRAQQLSNLRLPRLTHRRRRVVRVISGLVCLALYLLGPFSADKFCRSDSLTALLLAFPLRPQMFPTWHDPQSQSYRRARQTDYMCAAR